MKATNIIWDVDNEWELEGLPTEIDIPNDITDEEEISDYITNITGFCHCGFIIEMDEAEVYEKVYDGNANGIYTD